jgi:MarR family transcriptional regulator, organic hydroperoxide resistance regulator
MKRSDSDLNQLLSGIIIRTALRIKNEAQRVFKAEGCNITPEQWAILRTLIKTGGHSQRELSEKTFKDTPNITRILDILEKQGLAVRKRHEKDRRSFKIFLTGKGRKMEKKLSHTIMLIEKKVNKNLDRSEITGFKKVLRAIYRNLGETPTF